MTELILGILEKAIAQLVRSSSARARGTLCFLGDRGLPEIIEARFRRNEASPEGDGIDDRKGEQFVDVPRQLVARFVIGKRAGRSEVTIVAKGFGDCTAQFRGRAEGESGVKACGFDECARPQAVRVGIRVGCESSAGSGEIRGVELAVSSLTRSGAKAQLEIHDSQNSCFGAESEFDVRE